MVQTSSKKKTHSCCCVFFSSLLQMGVQLLQIHKHNSPFSPQNKTFQGRSHFKNRHPARKELDLYCVDQHKNSSLWGFFLFFFFVIHLSVLLSENHLRMDIAQSSLFQFLLSFLKKKKKKIFQKKKKRKKRKRPLPFLKRF